VSYQFLNLLILAIFTFTGTNEWHKQIGIKTLAQTSDQVKFAVLENAKLITVRILSKRSSGSGVIIDHQGQTYTVLTCNHVANSSSNDKFSILTSNGKIYQGYRKRLSSLENRNLDLALIQFQSSTSYRVAIVGRYQNISVGDTVYAAGFPNYQYYNSMPIAETINWGLKAYKLTTGKVSLILTKQSLNRGYQLGNTNDVESGMSGGPLLDRLGQLVGINGRGKYPLQGIDAFFFSDGAMPSSELFHRMESLSWAIPISTYQQEK